MHLHLKNIWTQSSTFPSFPHYMVDFQTTCIIVTLDVTMDAQKIEGKREHLKWHHRGQSVQSGSGQWSKFFIRYSAGKRWRQRQRQRQSNSNREKTECTKVGTYSLKDLWKAYEQGVTYERYLYVDLKNKYVRNTGKCKLQLPNIKEYVNF